MSELPRLIPLGEAKYGEGQYRPQRYPVHASTSEQKQNVVQRAPRTGRSLIMAAVAAARQKKKAGTPRKKSMITTAAAAFRAQNIRRMGPPHPGGIPSRPVALSSDPSSFGFYHPEARRFAPGHFNQLQAHTDAVVDYHSSTPWPSSGVPMNTELHYRGVSPPNIASPYKPLLGRIADSAAATGMRCGLCKRAMLFIGIIALIAFSLLQGLFVGNVSFGPGSGLSLEEKKLLQEFRNKQPLDQQPVKDEPMPRGPVLAPQVERKLPKQPAEANLDTELTRADWKPHVPIAAVLDTMGHAEWRRFAAAKALSNPSAWVPFDASSIRIEGDFGGGRSTCLDDLVRDALSGNIKHECAASDGVLATGRGRAAMASTPLRNNQLFLKALRTTMDKEGSLFQMVDWGSGQSSSDRGATVSLRFITDGVHGETGTISNSLPGLLPGPAWSRLDRWLPHDDSLLAVYLPGWGGEPEIPKELVRTLALCVDMVLVPSATAKDVLLDALITPARVQILPPPSNTPLFTGLLHQKFKFPTFKKIVFLAVGELSYRRGSDILLKAFFNTFKSSDNVVLYLHTSSHTARTEQSKKKGKTKKPTGDGTRVHRLGADSTRNARAFPRDCAQLLPGCIPVRDIDECDSAARMLGIEHSQVSVVGGNAEPRGCSFNTHTKELNFKMGVEGAPCNPTRICVCNCPSINWAGGSTAQGDTPSTADLTQQPQLQAGNQEITDMLKKLSSAPDAPQLLMDDKRLTVSQFHSLYRGAAAVISVFRKSDFGPPEVLDAALCDVTVVTTRAPPITDFLQDSDVHLIDAHKIPCDKWPCHERRRLDDTPSAGSWWWRPDVQQLSTVLRRLYQEKLNGGRRRLSPNAKSARERVVKLLSLKNVGRLFASRLTELQQLQRSRGWTPMRHRGVKISAELAATLEGEQVEAREYFPCTEPDSYKFWSLRSRDSEEPFLHTAALKAWRAGVSTWSEQLAQRSVRVASALSSWSGTYRPPRPAWYQKQLNDQQMPQQQQPRPKAAANDGYAAKLSQYRERMADLDKLVREQEKKREDERFQNPSDSDIEAIIRSGSQHYQVNRITKAVIKDFCKHANAGPYPELSDGERTRMLPSFVTAGAVKGGVRTFFHNLAAHRQMRVPKCRQIDFFLKPDSVKQGINLYRKYFPWREKDASPKPVTGEGSTTYFFKQNIPRRIQLQLPDIRLLYLLRNPTHRFIARWLQPIERREFNEIQAFEKRYGVSYDCNNVFNVYKAETVKCKSYSPPGSVADNDKEDLSDFGDCELASHNYLTQGLYVFALKRWLESFPNPGSHFVAQAEHLFSKPVEFMQRAARHIGMLPFTSEEQQKFVHLGTDKYANRQKILSDHGNKYATCDEEAVAQFYEPYNTRLRNTLSTLYESSDSKIMSMWRHW